MENEIIDELSTILDDENVRSGPDGVVSYKDGKVHTWYYFNGDEHKIKPFECDEIICMVPICIGYGGSIDRNYMLMGHYVNDFLRCCPEYISITPSEVKEKAIKSTKWRIARGIRATAEYEKELAIIENL